MFKSRTRLFIFHIALITLHAPKLTFYYILTIAEELGKYVCVYIRGNHLVMVIVVGNGHGDTSSNPQ